jgi:hypothetical protein
MERACGLFLEQPPMRRDVSMAHENHRESGSGAQLQSVYRWLSPDPGLWAASPLPIPIGPIPTPRSDSDPDEIVIAAYFAEQPACGAAHLTSVSRELAERR